MSMQDCPELSTAMIHDDDVIHLMKSNLGEPSAHIYYAQSSLLELNDDIGTGGQFVCL